METTLLDFMIKCYGCGKWHTLNKPLKPGEEWYCVCSATIAIGKDCITTVVPKKGEENVGEFLRGENAPDLDESHYDQLGNHLFPKDEEV